MTDPLCCRVAREAVRLTEEGRDWRADELINFLDPEGAELVLSLDLDDSPEDETTHLATLVAGGKEKNQGQGDPAD